MADVATNAFFYGLYMDPELLRKLGADPINPRQARLADYRLDLHGPAKILQIPGNSVWGMIVGLSPEHLLALYSGESTREYQPLELMVQASDSPPIAVICYNRPLQPGMPLNREYLEKLLVVARRLRLPSEYVRELESL